MGNLSVESGFSPTIYNGDHHTNDPKEADPYAWGLVQWLPPEKVLDEQTKSGVKGDIYKLAVQLDITWWEMKNSAPASGAGFMGGFHRFKNESQLGDAVTYWQQYFEGSLGQGDSERLTAAQEIYNKYKDSVPSPDSGSSSTSSVSGSCSCTESTASGSGTIVLDPGHSTFSDQSSQDSLTGLFDTDTTGGPNEMHDAWVAANKIKTLLEDKGYNVVLTKKSENESISLSQRAERANKTKGALLFTMHADSSVRWLAYPDKNSDREPGTGSRRDGTNGLVHPDIAKPSEDFAKTMAPIIAKGISKSGDTYDATSFADYYGAAGIPGNGLNKGNTPVQTILSSIPEVYSEVSPTDLPSDDFAKAATDAITTVVKPSGGGSGSDSGSGGCVGGGAVAGDLQATVKNYAWPNYSHVRTDPVPAFKEAIDTAESQGQYVGEKYTDCGGFVTRAMIDSGFEPNYNYSGKISKGALNTPVQMDWLQANWQKINPSDTSDLQPGDVAISSSHTFMYVGHIDGFNGAFASASQGTRVPMASSDSLSGYNWYRRK
jgi:N-acetylmuramoyl-L-alanine amidase